MPTTKLIVESPRWSRFPNFVKELAFRLDLKLDMTVNKGIIFETTMARITGDSESLQVFENVAKKNLDTWNDE